MKLLGVAEVVRLLPMSPGSGFGGSWLGWMLRSTLAPLIGYAEAREVVAMALGPGHDYASPMREVVTGTHKRAKRSDAGKKHNWKKELP